MYLNIDPLTCIELYHDPEVGLSFYSLDVIKILKYLIAEFQVYLNKILIHENFCLVTSKISKHS